MEILAGEVMEPQSAFEALMTDWIDGRDAATAVFRDKSALTSGWESRTGEAYSNHLTKGNVPWDKVKLLAMGHKLCTNRVRAMLPDRNVPVSYHPKDSFTDSNRIFIATEVVDCVDLTPPAKLDVLLGITTHEVLHILETNFDTKYSHNTFQFSILNILEDERIEHKCGYDFPGFAAYLEKLKAYYFDYRYKRKVWKNKREEVFSIFFRFVRYPATILEQEVMDNFDVLSKIKIILTPYPESFIDAYLASLEIEKIFIEEFGLQDEPEDKARKILAAIAKAFKDLDTLNGKFDKDSREQREQETSTELDTPGARLVAQGEAEETFLNTRSYFVKSVPDRLRYNLIKSGSKSSITSLASAFKTLTQEQTTTVQGMRNGQLDTSKIVACAFGEQTVYKSIHTVHKPTLDLVLMIDESGSMRDEKIIKAQQLTVILAEAVKQNRNTNLYAYGFTSDALQTGTNTLTVYSEPDMKTLEGIGSMKVGRGNRDGDCMLAVAERVRKITKNKALFIVISDGEPAADNYYDGVAQTRKAVKEISKKGFMVLQIGIDTNEDNQKLMFDHYINFENDQHLIQEIKKFILQTVKGFLSVR